MSLTNLTRAEVQQLAEADNPEGTVTLALLISPAALLLFMDHMKVKGVTVVDAPEVVE